MFSGSYGYNGWLYSDGKVDGDYAVGQPFIFVRPAMIQKPSATPVFFDENWVDLWAWETDLPCTNLYQGRSLYDREASWADAPSRGTGVARPRPRRARWIYASRCRSDRNGHDRWAC